MFIRTSKTRRRVERRIKEQRNEWLKANSIWVCAAICVIVLSGKMAYHFWYNYIPSTVEAADGQIKTKMEYSVTEGDTLDSISNRYYKEHGYDRPCSFENEVIEINNLHGRINHLEVGETLELPLIVPKEVYEQIANK